MLPSMVKKLKDKNAPKRPLTGFLLYGNELRARDQNIKSLPVTQQAGEIAKMWKELNETERDRYNRESEKLKEQYKTELAAYEKSDAYKDFQKAVKDSVGGEKTKRKRRKGPVKLSGYRLFMKENKDNVDEGLAEEDVGRKHIAKCGMKWKMLSEEERQEYNERAACMAPEMAGDDDSK